jgi:TPR repeat protein
MNSAPLPLIFLALWLMAQTVFVSSAMSAEEQKPNCTDFLERNMVLADQGDTVAQRTLGTFYANGYCVNQDYSAAIRWYKKAASNGDGISMRELGNIYGRGYGVEPNLEETLKWLQLAEENGQVVGRVYGLLYLDGVLVSKSIGRAYSLFLQAAEQGDPAAQYIVSMEYFRGKHLMKNPEAALMWLTRSAENGYGKAYRVLGGVYAFGSYGITRNNAEAGKWFALAKDQDTQTALDIAEMYLEGRGVNQDIEKSIEYYNELAQKYVVEAHLKLGEIYVSVALLQPDYRLAEEHFKLADKLGSAEASYHLGLMWLNGQGHMADRSSAIDMFEWAAENDYVFAYYYLGLIEYNRPGGKRDLRLVYDFFAAAATTLDPDLAAQAHAAKNAVAIELGLISAIPGLARVDRWSGPTPGNKYHYVHQPRRKWLSPVIPEEAEESAAEPKMAKQPLPYEPPPPPMLIGVPGGDIDSIDSKINPVFQ